MNLYDSAAFRDNSQCAGTEYFLPFPFPELQPSCVLVAFDSNLCPRIPPPPVILPSFSPPPALARENIGQDRSPHRTAFLVFFALGRPSPSSALCPHFPSKKPKDILRDSDTLGLISPFSFLPSAFRLLSLQNCFRSTIVSSSPFPPLFALCTRSQMFVPDTCGPSRGRF